MYVLDRPSRSVPVRDRLAVVNFVTKIAILGREEEVRKVVFRMSANSKSVSANLDSDQSIIKEIANDVRIVKTWPIRDHQNVQMTSFIRFGGTYNTEINDRRQTAVVRPIWRRSLPLDRNTRSALRRSSIPSMNWI
jgi:hypothetical protein